MGRPVPKIMTAEIRMAQKELANPELMAIDPPIAKSAR
jgi:hypothetical protein